MSSKAEELVKNRSRAERYLNGPLSRNCEYGHQQCANSTHGACSGELADLLIETLPARIMELQAKGSLTERERAELAHLQTEWSNHCLSPNEHPTRKT
jgi:hypothetical protein